MKHLAVPIIRNKLSVPPLAERLVERPRLSQLITELIDDNRVLWVVATAGAGKTTAVVQAAALRARPLAWLTLDGTDTAPGRLLIYLEAALAEHVREADGLASRALAAGIPHTEAAGLLAEAIADNTLLLVLDGLENLVGAHEALSVISAMIRYAPVGLKIVLLSRVDVPIDVGVLTGVDRVAAVGEADLAFTTQEAAGALVKAGKTTVDPAQAVMATGGWVTGVLFEAWRSRQHVAGTGGEADPLHGYLASQILGSLDEEERAFLISTSLLDEVTSVRAAALGEHHAGERLVALRAKHLPVSWISGAYRMRCHPRFREYLITCFERRDQAEVMALRRAYGELLHSEGHLEEAVEQFLAAGALERALIEADGVINEVIDRLDFAVAERWVSALASPDAPSPRALALAQLMLAIAGEDYHRGGSIADGLESAGAREELARRSPKAAGIMAWSYWHLARLEDMRAVMAAAARSPELKAVRYLYSLVDHTAPAASAAPVLSGGPLDALVMRVHYAHGRLHEVSRTPASRWAAAVSAPWRIGALRATGRLGEALELYQAADAGHWAPAWMHGIVGAELMIDLEDAGEVRRVLARGRELIRASGSVVFEWLSAIIEAKFELRLNRDPAAAMAILDQVEAAGGRRYDFISEGLDTWRGLALLMSGPEGEAAAAVLRGAVASMVAANRTIDLPAAAVYLAEAEWRRGDLAAADDAADQALAAAHFQQSNHQILLALEDFEAVIARRLDAETGANSPWHELGRALGARGIRAGREGTTDIVLFEFGRIAMTVDGQDVKPRITKSLALLAYLIAAPDHAANRDRLLAALFDGRSDSSARSYLRQAVHRLREILPEGVGPAFVGNQLVMEGAVTLTSDSNRLEILLAQAARLQGAEKLDELTRALEILDGGEYLPGVESAWAVQRREDFEVLAVEARLEAAQLAFAGQQYRRAGQLAEDVVAGDSFKESAWRLLMQIANALGDEDLVVATFRRCKLALEELDVTPSDSTQQLFEQLRR